jgi:hypothetical protein
MGGDLTHQRQNEHTIFELTLPLVETANGADHQPT